MALHKVKLPKSAAYLFGIVVLQKRLLRALADPSINAGTVTTAWVQSVLSSMDPEWVRKFCLGGEKSILHPLATIAGATLAARQALYDEFCRQNKVAAMLLVGGDFQDVEDLPGFTLDLADAVKTFFGRCYRLLSNEASRQWNGFEFDRNRSITNGAYKEDFCQDYPTKVVCPYCDGEIQTPELDHYLSKSRFPLLACSPWNLVPICRSCNDMITAKGDRPAITLGPPRSTDDWLHPFFRAASNNVRIALTGTPKNSIPELHSADPAEQIRLNNHTNLIRSLGKRWTNVAAARFDRLVREVNDRIGEPGNSIQSLVMKRLEDHQKSRGRDASSMVHTAVCQAVLDQRPEYMQEFTTPNSPALV
jgi:hypothetical protein